MTKDLTWKCSGKTSELSRSSEAASSSAATWLHLRNETQGMQILVFLCDGACSRDGTFILCTPTAPPLAPSLSWGRKRSEKKISPIVCAGFVDEKRVEKQFERWNVSVTHTCFLLHNSREIEHWVDLGGIWMFNSVNTDKRGLVYITEVVRIVSVFTWLELGKSRVLFRCFDAFYILSTFWFYDASRVGQLCRTTSHPNTHAVLLWAFIRVYSVVSWACDDKS